jgi:hypothetical protein
MPPKPIIGTASGPDTPCYLAWRIPRLHSARQLHASARLAIRVAPGSASFKAKSASKSASVPIKGFATPESTSAYASFFGSGGFSRVETPQGQIAASRLGFGTHRVSGAPKELDALKLALRGGINVVDSASFFEQGKAEKAVGKVLSEVLKPGSESRLSLEMRGIAPSKDAPLLSRSSLILMSKCGTIPPSLAADLPPDLPTYSLGTTGSRHSIDPDFISWSIDRSRTRMGVETIDFYGIDGIEQLLKGSGLKEATVWDLFESAVAFLERESAAGQRIRGWFLGSSGIAGASAPGANKEKDGVLSLSRVLDIVAKVASQGRGKTGHLIGIEYPSNLFERAAFVPGGLGEQAKSAGLWQLTNRTLNVVTPSGKVRTLSDGPRSAERWLAGEPASSSNAGPDPLPPLFQILSQHEMLLNTSDPGLALAWSTLVLDNLDALAGNALACRAWVDRKLLPGIEETVGVLLDEDEGPSTAMDEMSAKEIDEIEGEEGLDPEVITDLARSYASLLKNKLAPALLELSSKNAAAENAELAGELGRFVLPEQRAARTWGAQGWALEFALDDQGKPGGGETTTLLGMRAHEYVRFALEVGRKANEGGLGKEGWENVLGKSAMLKGA